MVTWGNCLNIIFVHLHYKTLCPTDPIKVVYYIDTKDHSILDIWFLINLHKLMKGTNVRLEIYPYHMHAPGFWKKIQVKHQLWHFQHKTLDQDLWQRTLAIWLHWKNIWHLTNLHQNDHKWATSLYQASSVHRMRLMVKISTIVYVIDSLRPSDAYLRR